MALVLSGPAHAQYIGEAPPPLPVAPIGLETPSDALARNVRILAQSPRNYPALLGAGRAALATGDAEAAVGFFGRAADISPNAPAPKAGMGSALAALGEAREALAEFDKAQRLGALVSSLALDRGLARDLLGQQALAQADYRLALTGPDSAEARRRLSLSLAISGNRLEAMSTLAPLLQRSDVSTNRVRAFVLALGGDAAGAGRALDQSVPGMSRQLDPFFRRLPGLNPAQKAAAVHLGVMPGNGLSNSDTGLAAGPVFGPPPSASSSGLAPRASGTLIAPTPRGSIITDRLAGIDELLRQPSEAAKPLVTRPPAPVAAPAAPRPVTALPAPKRLWIQLASGTNEAALASEFSKIAAREPDLFKGIRPYVSEVGGKTKLLIGPFKSDDDSETFVANLADARINGFSWTSPEGQPVRKLSSP